MSKPRVVRLIMPADGKESQVGSTAALTLVPLAGNKIFYYNGDLQEALRNGSFGTAGYGPDGGVGDIIRQKQIAMDRHYKGGRKEMMLLIKPASEASYGNVVSLLNETLINNVSRYALVKLTPEEKSCFSSKIL